MHKTEGEDSPVQSCATYTARLWNSAVLATAFLVEEKTLNNSHKSHSSVQYTLIFICFSLTSAYVPLRTGRTSPLPSSQTPFPAPPAGGRQTELRDGPQTKTPPSCVKPPPEGHGWLQSIAPGSVYDSQYCQGWGPSGEWGWSRKN